MLVLRTIKICLVRFKLHLQRLGQIQWKDADSDEIPVEVYC
jgi:hypothetical protein